MNKIYIAQYYTENLTHGPFAEKINQKYVNEMGYGYYCEKSTKDIRDFLKGIAPTWYKSKLILDVFDKYNPEYVLFLDTDAIISNPTIKIEEFIQSKKENEVLYEYLHQLNRRTEGKVLRLDFNPTTATEAPSSYMEFQILPK